MSWWILVLLFAGAEPEPVLMTVRGEVPAREFGKALVHEHVLCDFAGAKQTGPGRYDADDVVKVMRPYLARLKERGFSAFVDATPAYIGRDARLLRRLSELEGLHILTNTGYYGAAGDKFLPAHAFEETADQLAERWTKEWREGIDGTGIRPGFMKIGVDHGPLSVMDRKLVQAAARAHLKTGLTIACHTGEREAALGVLAIVEEEGVHPSALIVVHADGIAAEEARFRLADAGAWVEYDGAGGRPVAEHVALVQKMFATGRADRLLISHDAGWYAAGQAGGAREKIRPYTFIAEQLLPALDQAGLGEEAARKLLVTNPRQAFAVRVRKR